MGNTFTKLFESILDSTVWQEPLPTKVVWITMLAMADRDGRVWASVPGLAKRAGVTLAEGEAALKRFLSPDEYSRSQEEDGKRVREIDGGWELINHNKYRQMLSVEERREYQRVKQAEYRAKKKAGVGGKTAAQVRGEYDNRQERYEKAGSEAERDRIVAENLPGEQDGPPDDGNEHAPIDCV